MRSRMTYHCFRDDGDAEFIDDFSDMLLLKLFDLAIAGCHDNDKVKYNTVRALGSLLHYLPVRIIGEPTSSTLQLTAPVNVFDKV